MSWYGFLLGLGYRKTYQDSNFTSKLLSEIYRLLHIHSLRTSPYHPQTDGLVERINGTLKAMLRKVVVEDVKSWDRWLSFLLFAYREVPLASTGFLPLKLLHVRGPLDIVKGAWEGSKSTKDSVVSHVLGVLNKLSKMAALAAAHLGEAQVDQKHWCDRNARQRAFQMGNVMILMWCLYLENYKWCCPELQWDILWEMRGKSMMLFSLKIRRWRNGLSNTADLAHNIPQKPWETVGMY